jgi:hypothetical protein
VIEAGRDGHLTVRDIEDLQALMRGCAPAQRSEAVARLRALRGTILDADVARAALRAAGVSYPWVPGVPDDTSELFVHLLWGDPTIVEVTELERSYMFCAERGRRAVLRTMALRADRAGLEAVEYLLDAEGPQESLPAPSSGLLSPLLAVEGVDRLAPKLISLVLRRGWSEHAAEMIISMCQRGLLDTVRADEVATSLVPVVDDLTAACDRRCAPRTLGTQRRADTTSVDLARVDRRRLMALLPLLAHLPTDTASVGLRRALSCADPRVAATAAVGLIGRGDTVGEDRLRLLCRSPLARAVLLRGLTAMGREFQLPSSALTPVAVAEAHLVTWLASAVQLRCEPDEVEHRGVLPALPEWGHGLLHVFAFRVNKPHWVAERDWVVAVVGPFDPSSELTPAAGDGFAVHSIYEPEASMSHEQHVFEITASLCAGREDPTP